VPFWVVIVIAPPSTSGQHDPSSVVRICRRVPSGRFVVAVSVAENGGSGSACVVELPGDDQHHRGLLAEAPDRLIEVVGDLSNRLLGEDLGVPAPRDQHLGNPPASANR